MRIKAFSTALSPNIGLATKSADLAVDLVEINNLEKIAE